jgi:predicted dehydrogenase
LKIKSKVMTDFNSALQKPSFSRKTFISATTKGLVSAMVLGQMNAHAEEAKAEAEKLSKKDLEASPVKLKPLDHPTEREDSPLFTPAAPDKRIGFAIVGLGHLTLDQLLPAFQHCKFAKPVALVSGDAEKARKVATQYGIEAKKIYGYENFDLIRNNKEVDVVYIVLPNSMHEEFTVRAAKAGKHVLCEKPMSTSAESCQRMIDACKQAGKKLMVAYRIQYEPHNRQIMKWVREKHFGTVKLIDAFNAQNIGDPAQWRLKKAMGGGALPDVGIYCLNTARFILGEEPESVLATAYSTPNDNRFTEVDEHVLFQLRFPSGTLVSCGTSFGVHESRRYRCYGTKGAWFGMDPAFSYEGLRMEMSQAIGKQEWRQHPYLGSKNQFALEMDHLATCIAEDKEPYTKGEEGWQDVRIIEAIYTSAREGKIVPLEKIAGLDTYRGTAPKD